MTRDRRFLPALLLLVAGLSLRPGSAEAASPIFTEILGRPTDTSVTVNARADQALEIYFEYGPAAGSYTSQTPSGTAAPLAPTEFLMSGFSPDSRGWYRMRYRATGSTGPFAAGPD